jgi:hypothetical protein
MRQRLKKHWKKIVLTVGIGFVMIIEALILTADHWWKKLGQAQVAYNGQPSSNPGVYRSRDGDLLVIVEAEGRETQYVILTLNQMIGKADQMNFILLPGFAYSRNVPPSLVLIDNMKVEVDPQLIVQQRLIEFNSLEQGRVRVTW